jgi:hypothetical protein
LVGGHNLGSKNGLTIFLCIHVSCTVNSLFHT